MKNPDPADLTAVPKSKLRTWHIQRFAGKQFVDALTLLTYLFLFAPMVILVFYSFNAGRSTTVWQGFSLDWYGVLFKDRYVFHALKNSLIVAFTSASISTFIGSVTALTLVRRKFWGREFYSTIMLAPLVLPEIVLGVAFLVFMVSMNFRLGFGTLILSHSVLLLPYATLIVRSAASGLDETLEQAAADLGATEVLVFRHITFPLLIPGILGAFLLTFTISFDNYVISLFASGVGTTTLPLQIFSMLKTGLTPEINALGTVLILFNLALILIVGGKHTLRLING